MQRLIIERIEGRVLVGITMFLAIMILIGWITINEEARMASFDRQYLARSIERGGELFAANCTTCHGADGRGVNGFAPALNSPHLFGIDFLKDVNTAIFDLESEQTALEAERANLNTELSGDPAPSAERQREILVRIDDIDARLPAIAEEMVPLAQERVAIIAQLQPARQNGYLPRIDGLDETALTKAIQTNGTRLAQVGWAGDVQSYVFTTLVHGRPGSFDVWNGNAMVAWSDRAGGPMRDDQIEDITNYILNFNKGDNFTLEDLFAVNQFGKPHADGSFATTGGVTTVGTDVATILSTLETDGIVGDAAKGEQLYLGQTPTESGPPLNCFACHTGAVAAPDTIGTWTRAEERITSADLAGYTAEQYVIESIVNPSAFVVENYVDVMPKLFGEQLSHQDLADVIAYLTTQTE